MPNILTTEPIAGFNRVLVITENPDGCDGATRGILEMSDKSAMSDIDTHGEMPSWPEMEIN